MSLSRGKPPPSEFGKLQRPGRGRPGEQIVENILMAGGSTELPRVVFDVFISNNNPELMYVRTLLVKLNVIVLSIIDPGARFTLINEQYKGALEGIMEGPTAMIRGVGSCTPFTGSGDCNLLLEGGITLRAHAHIFPKLPVALLIGMKELYENFFRIDFRKREIRMDDTPIPVVEKAVAESDLTT